MEEGRDPPYSKDGNHRPSSELVASDFVNIYKRAHKEASSEKGEATVYDVHGDTAKWVNSDTAQTAPSEPKSGCMDGHIDWTDYLAYS